MEVESPTAEADRMKTDSDGKKQRNLIVADVINPVREEQEDEKAATLTGMEVACVDIDGVVGRDAFGRKASVPNWDAGLGQGDRNKGYDAVVNQGLQRGHSKRSSVKCIKMHTEH